MADTSGDFQSERTGDSDWAENQSRVLVARKGCCVVGPGTVSDELSLSLVEYWCAACPPWISSGRGQIVARISGFEELSAAAEIGRGEWVMDRPIISSD